MGLSEMIPNVKLNLSGQNAQYKAMNTSDSNKVVFPKKVFVPNVYDNKFDIFDKKTSKNNENEIDSIPGYVSVIVDLVNMKRLKNQMSSLRYDGTEYYIIKKPNKGAREIGNKYNNKVIIDTLNGNMNDFQNENSKELGKIINLSVKLADIKKEINNVKSGTNKADLLKQQNQIQTDIKNLIKELSNNDNYTVKQILSSD
ncbi:hypothetical protein IJG72_03685 [bacterium]|nr:hypothetical protein [bacterium]